MAVPSKKAQAEALATWLELDHENMTTLQVATYLIDKVYDLWSVDVTEASPPLKVGYTFKTPIIPKVMHVAWMGLDYAGRETVWIVAADSKYGWLGPVGSTFWRITHPSTAKAGAPGNNKAGWQVGDRLSTSQRAHHYEVLATGDNCVLMRNIRDGSLQADQNDNLEKHYRKESK